MHSILSKSPSRLLALGLFAAVATAPLAAPAAQPAAKATCSAPDHLAAVYSSLGAQYPLVAREENLQGTALVRVSLSQAGRLTDAAIATSSGFDSLDNAALAAVRNADYQPETVACQTVPGKYLVEVTFDQ